MDVVRPAAAVVATLAATLSLLASPAQAATRDFTDRVGETQIAGDVTRVRVDNATTRDRVKVSVDVGAVDYGSFATVWLDTEPSRPGPEFRVNAYPDSDGLWVSRVSGFRDRGRLVGCDRLRVAASAGADQTFRFWVPRSCLGDPGQVRLSVRSRYEDASATVADSAPGFRRFFPWVDRG